MATGGAAVAMPISARCVGGGTRLQHRSSSGSRSTHASVRADHGRAAVATAGAASRPTPRLTAGARPTSLAPGRRTRRCRPRAPERRERRPRRYQLFINGKFTDSKSGRPSRRRARTTARSSPWSPRATRRTSTRRSARRAPPTKARGRACRPAKRAEGPAPDRRPARRHSAGAGAPRVARRRHADDHEQRHGPLCARDLPLTGPASRPKIYGTTTEAMTPGDFLGFTAARAARRRRRHHAVERPAHHGRLEDGAGARCGNTVVLKPASTRR